MDTNIETQQPDPPVVKRRRGRPPRVRPAEPPPVETTFGVTGGPATETPIWNGAKAAGALAAPSPTRATWGGYPIMPDDEMEHYGGDLAAYDGYYLHHPQTGELMVGRVHPRVRAKQATWRDNTRTGTLPDLSYKGMLVNRHDPSLLFHFIYLTEDGSPYYQQMAMAMFGRGYKPVTVADFYVHSSLRPIFTSEDGTGRLTLGALKGSVTVVYCQDQASYDRMKKHERKFSDAIQETAEQRAAQMREELTRDGFDGVTAFSSVEEVS